MRCYSSNTGDFYDIAYGFERTIVISEGKGSIMKRMNIPAALVAGLFAGLLVSGPVYAKEAVIPEGVYVGDFSLGGMTEDEARKTIENYMTQQSGREIDLKIADQTVTASAGDLGYSWANPDAIEEAVSYAAGGNLVQQYMKMKDIEKNPVHLPLETRVEKEALEKFFQENCGGMTNEPQNAAIARVDGKFVITPGVAGVTIDAEATRQAVDQALAGNPAGEEISVPVAVTKKEPDITEEMLATIQDTLGTFSTDFSSSGSSRAGNLRNGAEKINGHVLMPGETLSGYECMHPFTTANGYYTAAAYENGQVVDSVGGGVCQIASTLYNAALRAELDITQRQNHSMIVTYVKPSMDAAIAGTVKDIKITNNYSTPVYVEGGTSGRTLTFTFYGKETRPANRVVEYVSETLSRTSAGAPTERVDPSMAPGARRKVQSAHNGLKSRLWKVVTVDGVETERTILHTDTYMASKAIFLVGPPAAPPAEQQVVPAETQPAQEQETQASIIEGVNGGPGVSGGQQGEAAQVPAETSGPAQALPDGGGAGVEESSAPNQTEQALPPAMPGDAGQAEG